MSERDAFIRAVGRRLLHVTARSNRAGIDEQGLLPPDALARAAGVNPRDITLRRDRVLLTNGSTTARLNHQKPILFGLNAANRVVDGHDAESWATQLDQRVFFWPERAGRRFLKSVARDVDIAVLHLDAGVFFDLLRDRADLSPINSGNFTQGGAHVLRGHWIYVPLNSGMDAFRRNRKKRGLVRNPDTVKEISVRDAISREDLREILCGVAKNDAEPTDATQ